VTSLQWLDDSYYKIKNGSSIWTHEVVVIEPKHTVYRNVSFVYLSSLHARCNDEQPITGSTFDIEMADAVAVDSKSLAVVLHQVPNCHMVFKDDPSHKKRNEDNQIAWSFKMFLDAPEFRPELMLFFPMIKSSLLGMKAAKEFMLSNLNADESLSFTVCGASKRGWTSWLIGGVTCDSCPQISAIFPLVPIAPSL